MHYTNNIAIHTSSNRDSNSRIEILEYAPKVFGKLGRYLGYNNDMIAE